MKDLDAQMIAAHEACDLTALIRLYTRAADQASDLTAACFYLTHAYVFALEAGSADAKRLHQRLKAHGREE